MEQQQAIETTVCIAGGGPAGMVLGYLLARAGIEVTVLEKHADFLRDFRGDTVHPSTLQIIQDCGLWSAFEALPQQREQILSAKIGSRFQPVIDFRGLEPFDYLAFVPQWHFLDLFADAGAGLPDFDLRMGHEVTGLIREGDQIRGVHATTGDGVTEIRAALVIGADGRDSRLRAASGLPVRAFGAPMDALWFRLSKGDESLDATQAVVGAGHMLVLIDRSDYWQAALVVPKGADRDLRQQPIEVLHELVARTAPEMGANVHAIESWDAVKTLAVQVNRLRRWSRPGLLMIGDAAHAMSPIGGVGINLAIQDAVATANRVVPIIQAGRTPTEAELDRVRRRRLLPTALVQAFQLQAQKRVVASILDAKGGEPPRLPSGLRWLLQHRRVRNLPAWLIGYGFRRERPTFFSD